MNKQLQELFYSEMDHRHLDFDAFPEYTDLLHQSMVIFPGGDLPGEIVQLLDTSNCISFAHGLRLGLRLKRWAQSLPL